MAENQPTGPFQVFVAFRRTLSPEGERGLAQRLSDVLPTEWYAFRRGELLIRDLASMDIAFPIMSSLVEEVWTSAGKSLTDRYLTVYDTHEMRCPSCGLDSALDVTASVNVRLIREGASIDDARDSQIQWSDGSPCSCSCGWISTVAQAKA